MVSFSITISEHIPFITMYGCLFDHFVLHGTKHTTFNVT